MFRSLIQIYTVVYSELCRPSGFFTMRVSVSHHISLSSHIFMGGGGGGLYRHYTVGGIGLSQLKGLVGLGVEDRKLVRAGFAVEDSQLVGLGEEV